MRYRAAAIFPSETLMVSSITSPQAGFSTVTLASAGLSSPTLRGCSKWLSRAGLYIGFDFNGYNPPFASRNLGAPIYIHCVTSRVKFLPQRIVSLQPSATVMLQSLGALDRVVACTKYCVDVCPEVAERAIVADSWTAQSDQIMAAKPDLVIASVPYQIEAVGEILKCGVPFLGLAPRALTDIYKDFAMIARVIGEENRAETAIAHMQDEIEAIRKRASAGNDRPLVYCEEWGKPLIHSQGWVAELVEAAGGRFLGTPGSHTEPAVVARQAPDFIIAAWCGAGDRVPLAKIVEQRGWSELKAVERRNVFCIPDEFLNTPAPTLIEGLKALAGIIHPELFPPHPRVKRL